MSDENKKLWNAVCKTDPDHVKKISGKSYQGSSPKPYYLIERATDTFGPCGIGWGIDVIEERFFNFSETEIHHFATVEFWYVLDGKRGTVRQMGGTRAAYITSAGKFTCDEDAPKKSITDGMVKAMSMVGFAGDIFGGRWDDSKYQDELKAEKDSAIADTQYQLLVDKWMDSLVCVREALAVNDYSTAKEALNEIDRDALVVLWKAPSKGGWFTTEERAKMKSNEWANAV